jgi:hypothetical protein
MTAERLASLLTRPDVHKLVLGDYQGPYALGVTSWPGREGEGALRLRVQGEPAEKRRTIFLEGEVVLLLIEGNFSQPKPLNCRLASG